MSYEFWYFTIWSGVSGTLRDSFLIQLPRPDPLIYRQISSPELMHSSTLTHAQQNSLEHGTWPISLDSQNPNFPTL